ncbi:hypothetical protein ABTC39_20295, partial [Acinetobacter baumannii]
TITLLLLLLEIANPRFACMGSQNIPSYLYALYTFPDQEVAFRSSLSTNQLANLSTYQLIS